jgi:hypothetical protein
MVWVSVDGQNWQAEWMKLLLNSMEREEGRKWCIVEPEMIGWL